MVVSDPESIGRKHWLPEADALSDFALREAAWILQHMLAGREDILRVLATNHVRLTVMAWNEYTTDVPEHRHLLSHDHADLVVGTLCAGCVRAVRCAPREQRTACSFA